jgi:hypothetical protein
MDATPFIQCPLCDTAIPGSELFSHIVSEPQPFRSQIIDLIAAYHPGWVHERGACLPCWKSYREATRAINSLKHVGPLSHIR